MAFSASTKSFQTVQKDSFDIDIVGNEGLDLSGEKQARFHELLVQAKFAAGITDFKPQELPYLKAWLEKTGPTKALNLLNVILDSIAKGDTRKNFPQSVLAHLLEELGISHQAIATIL